LTPFNDVINGHPDIKVVATGDAYWDTAKSENDCRLDVLFSLCNNRE
jgi:hypothetical protein